MFISKKKLKERESRIDALEHKTTVQTYDFGTVDLKALCWKLPDYISRKIKAAVTANNNRLNNEEI